MAIKPVFTDKRRELLAKTIMDVEKIIIAAAFASGFFIKFSLPIRLLIAGLIIAVGIAGFFVCPRGGE